MLRLQVQGMNEAASGRVVSKGLARARGHGWQRMESRRGAQNTEDRRGSAEKRGWRATGRAGLEGLTRLSISERGGGGAVKVTRQGHSWRVGVCTGS